MMKMSKVNHSEDFPSFSSPNNLISSININNLVFLILKVLNMDGSLTWVNQSFVAKGNFHS